MNSLSDISEDADLRRVFGRFPTGVTALCGMEGDKPIGMTASAFTAISLQPALVSVCIKQGSATWRQLRTRQRIGISFLGRGHAAAARQLAQRSDNRFSGLDYEVTADGALFLANATAWLDCSVETEIAAGDHDIVLFRLHRAAVAEGIMPLVFHSSDFHVLAPIG
jgi:flavin reductase (DIM6/NTAB) family NADH-FMN oxidoreductase RutF